MRRARIVFGTGLVFLLGVGDYLLLTDMPLWSAGIAAAMAMAVAWWLTVPSP